MAEEWIDKGKEPKGEEAELETLKAIDRDGRWFGENYDRYKKIFEGKIIAVKDEKILSVGDDMQELSNEIEEKGEDPRWVYVTTIPPKDVVFIL
ncbi:MAG: DUF5678 domain-containing protein [Halobacteriota archaeon]